MKKTIALLLCLMLALTTLLSLAACSGDAENPDGDKPAVSDTTPSTTPDESADDTGVEADTDTEATADTETEPVLESTPDESLPESGDAENPAESGDESTPAETGEEGETYDPELYVLIYTAEDLMQFNENVNGEDSEEDYSFMTVLFMDDIDMTGYQWKPLDGYWLEDVVFDGQGHTISNLQFEEFNPEPYGATTDFGSGFIGVNYYKNTFKNITFKNASVDAKRSHVGCIIGTNRCMNGEDVIFENVHVDGFVGAGTLPGNGTTIRVGGFIGANAGGYPVFTDCSAKNLELQGFHNLAAFVGYDMANSIAETSFTNCVVENCKFTFSYCQSDSYTTDMPRKFVSVFYNASNWADNISYVTERGNTFSEVYYYDWTDDNAEYRAEEFLSWTREEAEADAAQG